LDQASCGGLIIHKLITQCLQRGDDAGFYLEQARDAIRWMERAGVGFGPQTRALDLGCGHGVFGGELVKRGCPTVFADEDNFLLPELAGAPFRRINIDRDNLATLGEYDLVVCSNVYEHLAKPNQFLETIDRALAPQGKLYLSWTNWLSPWGGHEFSPFHYLGARRGHVLFDRLIKRKRKHTPFENLYPTYIGQTLRAIRQSPTLRIIRAAPRYYTEFAFLIHLPLAREFLAWNCALLIGRREAEGVVS
jgi:SAM-dependent methyltransferase